MPHESQRSRERSQCFFIWPDRTGPHCRPQRCFTTWASQRWSANTLNELVPFPPTSESILRDIRSLERKKPLALQQIVRYNCSFAGTTNGGMDLGTRMHCDVKKYRWPQESCESLIPMQHSQTLDLFARRWLKSWQKAKSSAGPGSNSIRQLCRRFCRLVQCRK